MKAFILMVTWFFYGQPPTSTQAEFTSMEACVVARNAVLADATRLKADSDQEVALPTVFGGQHDHNDDPAGVVMLRAKA